MFISSRPLINKETLFNHIDQKQIFEQYGVEYTTKQFKSPLRNDNHPSCSFFYGSDGTLLLKDWTLNETINAIGFVANKYGMSNTDAMYKIYDDFKLELKDVSLIEQSEPIEISKSKKSKIAVVKQPYTQLDIEYFKSYHITSKQCNTFRVYSIRNLFLNGSMFHTYSSFDPMIGYYFGTNGSEERWKIYFYKRKKSTVRFICNTNRIAGWIQLPSTGNILVITKSLKDVMVFNRLGYHAISPQSESFQFYESIIDELKQRFKRIVVIYDNDEPGIIASKLISQQFNLESKFMESKDLSDQMKKTGYTATEEYVKHLLW
jgi:hypothetical protein